MNTARSHRRRRRIGSLVGLSVLFPLLFAASGLRAAQPRIVVLQDVPQEVTDAVGATWQSYTATFPAQSDCIGTVELLLVRELAGGDASYSAEERLVRIEIPTTPAKFTESLAHELGHHLERYCGVVDELGERLLAAQGFDPATDWYHSKFWFEAPSEHFAETVVLLVNHDRIRHPDVVEVSAAASELVAGWGLGR